MFINKWLVTDSFNKAENTEKQTGLCVYITKEPNDVSHLYLFLQKQPAEGVFTLLLSGDDFEQGKVNDSYIDKIIGLFFQPAYYLVNYEPLLFLKNRTAASTEFLDRLIKKSVNQGFRNLLVIETKTTYNTDHAPAQFGYWVTGSDIDYIILVRKWLAQYIDGNNPTEIHILISPGGESLDNINTIIAKENNAQKTEEFKLANVLYQKQKLIDGYKHQLSLKMTNEKHNQIYLSIQKEERANGLKWYYYEYEILPLWYKRFGHILKVITGKRTFRSLFRDDVKKYKE